jgi:hypothetical protein
MGTVQCSYSRAAHKRYRLNSQNYVLLKASRLTVSNVTFMPMFLLSLMVVPGRSNISHGSVAPHAGVPYVYVALLSTVVAA